MNGTILGFKTKRSILYKRMLATIIDYILLLIISIQSNLEIGLRVLFMFILILLYYVFLESLFGATVGKFLLKIRVIDKECKKPSFFKSFIRFLFRVIEVNPIISIMGVISYYFTSNSTFKQRFGGKISKTFVVNKKDLIEFKNDYNINNMSFDEYLNLDYPNETANDLNCSHKEIKSFKKYYAKVKSINLKSVNIENLEDVKFLLQDLSDYDFKIKFLKLTNTFGENIAKLILNEEQKRKEKNVNYTNYDPQFVFTDNAYAKTEKHSGFKEKMKSILKLGLVIIGVVLLLNLFTLLESDYKKAEAFYIQGDYNEAISLLEKNSISESIVPDALLLYARSLYFSMRYREALDVYKKIEILQRNDFDVLLEIAYTKENLYRFDEALNYYNKALKLKDSLDAHSGKVYSLYRLAKYDEAIELADFILEKEPNNIRALNSKALSYLYTNEFDVGMNLLEEAFSIDANHLTTNISMLEALFYQQKFDDGIEFGLKALEKFPDSHVVIWWLGDFYYYKDENETAISYYKDAFNINPYDEVLAIDIAVAYYELEDYSNALKYAEYSKELNNEYFYPMFLIENIEEAMNHENERIVNFVRENYLYFDQTNNIEQLFEDFMSLKDVKIDDIESFINSIRHNHDKYTYFIHGENYKWMKDYANSNAVIYEHMDDGIHYIGIETFNMVAYNQFREIITSIEDSENQNLIIDLRDNGGGLLHSTNNMVSLLLPECTTTYLIYRDGDIGTYASNPYYKKFNNIFIFVNQNSASSAEMFPLSLKSYLNNVTIIGVPTEGKGVGQIVFENKEKEYMLFLVNHYWNVREQNIMGGNVRPDIFIRSDNIQDYLNIVKKELKRQ